VDIRKSVDAIHPLLLYMNRPGVIGIPGCAVIALAAGVSPDHTRLVNPPPEEVL